MSYERQRRYERRKSAAAADVGDIPAVVNPKRRARCRLDAHRFLVEYFPQSTGRKPFSEDHRRVIARNQGCVLDGGWELNIVYRGFAKTTIAENTSIWATFYGHRKFFPLFGATADDAAGLIDSIKLELAENDLLYDDFPEICHPIRCLEGKSQRCASQTYRVKCEACAGVPAGDDVEEDDRCEKCGGAGNTPTLTHIEWTSDTIVLPTLRLPAGFAGVAGVKDGAKLIETPASGAILTSRGLTGSTRGLKHKRPDGTQQRPDFFLIDDPQTDESAGSPLQVQKGMSRIKKSILKLGGHNRKIAGLVNATVIERNDLIEQLANPKLNPAWQVERIPMVRAWAGAKRGEAQLYLGALAGSDDVHEKMWLGEYRRLRETFDRDDPEDQRRARKRANAYYKKHRKVMDAGCVVSWEYCYDADAELSAIQHAYNELLDYGEEVFASECQNQPLDPNAGNAAAAALLTAQQICEKLNGVPRGVAPAEATRIVAFIDPKHTFLYWTVAAFDDDFNGGVIDYGTHPDQRRAYFAAREAKIKLAHPDGSMEAGVAAGLDELVNQLVRREFERDGGDGATLRLERCLIDARDGRLTDVVKAFCRRSPHAAILHPSQGLYFGAKSQRQMRDYAKKPGDRVGLNWRIPKAAGRGAVRTAQYDTNFWKLFMHQRLATAAGGRGALFLYGARDDRRAIERHRLFADHLVAETPTEVSARGRTVVEFQEPPGLDNDFLDCTVGCCVAASIGGSQLRQLRQPIAARKNVRYSDVQRARRLGLPVPEAAPRPKVITPAASPATPPAPEQAPAPATPQPRRRIRYSDVQKQRREGRK